MQTVKVLFEGDHAVGKTSLLITYITHGCPTEYVPEYFEANAYNTIVDGRDVTVLLWDAVRPGNRAWAQLGSNTFNRTNAIVRFMYG